MEEEDEDEAPKEYTVFRKSIDVQIKGTTEDEIEEELNELFGGKNVSIDFQENSRNEEAKNFIAIRIKFL